MKVGVRAVELQARQRDSCETCCAPITQSKRGGRRRFCNVCRTARDRERTRAWSRSDHGRAWQREHRPNYAGRNALTDRQRRDRRQAIVRAAKNVPCVDCGVRYPHYTMEFDHVRGVKRFNLSRAHHYSEDDLRDEIAKCDPVCANCHRERTHGKTA